MHILVTYIPQTHLEEVKNSLFAAGAGHIGSYDSCAWCCKGDGQFRALEGANPYIGKIKEVEKVVEYRLEVAVKDEEVEQVISALLKAHPYEVPAFHVIPVISTLEEFKNGKKS